MMEHIAQITKLIKEISSPLSFGLTDDNIIGQFNFRQLVEEKNLRASALARQACDGVEEFSSEFSALIKRDKMS